MYRITTLVGRLEFHWHGRGMMEIRLAARHQEYALDLRLVDRLFLQQGYARNVSYLGVKLNFSAVKLIIAFLV
jgi:hypothetical protein